MFQCVALLAAVLCAAAAPGKARELTIEDRFEAQGAIERVYHSHETGRSRPFEEVFPREVLERKVRAYLKKSAALERFWHTPVTVEMLEREERRISEHSRMPARLKELETALGNDHVLIRECLVRPIVVDRLARSFFAFDPLIHAGKRREAERLREQLMSGELDPHAAHPRRTVVDLVADDADPGASVKSEETDRAIGPARGSGSAGKGDREAVTLARVGGDGTDSKVSRIEVSIEELRERRSRALDPRSESELLEEGADSFSIRVSLESQPKRLRLATFAVPKRTWDDWWRAVEHTLDETQVSVVASDAPVHPPNARIPPDARSGQIPNRSRSMTSCEPAWLASPDVPTQRGNHSAVWTGSVMIVWGGIETSGGEPLGTGGRYDPATDTWEPTSTINAPEPRVAHAAVWTGSEMIVWGGVDYDPYFPFGSGGRYDPASDTWTPVSLAGAPEARFGHSAVWTGSRMVTWGGVSGGSYLSSGGQYDPSTDTWSIISTSGVPAPRYLHTSVWTGREMMVWGGRGSGVFFNSGGRYDPAADTWMPIEATSLVGRYEHSAVWTGTKMIIWGGGYLASGTDVALRDGARYDPLTRVWTAMSSNGAPTARKAHAAVWTGSRMIVSGGSDRNTILSSGGSYDPLSDSWSATSQIGARARHFHTAIWTGSRSIVWGGYGGSNTGGRYDPVSDSWTPTRTVGVIDARGDHSAVWTGSRMFVWGGYGNFPGHLNTGGHYDPAMDHWTPTSTLGAPSGRRSAAAAWTGSRMIVWGGLLNSSPLNTGARYDLATDTWMPIAATGAPSARTAASIVWTGSRLIVWGGSQSPGGSVMTGSRYDPESDVWHPTSVIGAPSARFDAATVWTGSSMIVWGGYTAFGQPLITGARYDPQTDSWQPISTNNAPSSPGRYKAVWTGARMIVCGLLPTSGLYDPDSDTWAPMATEGAPSFRIGFSAAWAGREMVIWGGYDGAQVFATGGRYDPSEDRWLPTSLIQAPSARQGHSVVWTGSGMIVWGGLNAHFQSVATGGQYDFGASIDADDDSYAECQGDCDDANASVHPGVHEICNGIDEDCNGSIDDESAALCDDEDSCTDDLCGGPSGCEHHANVSPCDDGDACSLGDACADGICRSGRLLIPKIDCNDGNACTRDLCYPDIGCLNAPIICRDGSSRTIDSCDPARGCAFRLDLDTENP